LSTAVSEPAVATPAAHSNFSTADHPTWDLYSRCIHCGLCLNQCPTYKLLGMEADSPRGRIYQIVQVDAGRLALGDSFVTHIDRCLGCRACETACPSGVQYGRILERARTEIERNYPRPWLVRKLKQYAYRNVLKHPRTLARWARVLRFYQRSGLQTFARTTGLLKLLGLEQVEALAPRIDDDFFLNDIGLMFEAEGERRGRVAFLAGCIASVAFSDLNRATIRVLTKNGIEVYVPPHQKCCGALHSHAGFRHSARSLARRNIRAFVNLSYDAIITNAAGCGAAMKEYGELLEHDPEYARPAQEFSAKVKDVNEYLASIALRPPDRPLQARVTYQDACHLAHAQKIRSAPRELLKAAGAEFVEMPNADTCCGSAGTYNVTQTDLAMRILAAKMDDVQSTRADVLATSNVGCLLQLQAGAKQRKLNLRVAHVVELLNECYVDPEPKHRRRKRRSSED